MEIRILFAQNLKGMRREKGYSQEAFAQMAHINRSYFSKLETGKTYAGLEIIAKLSDVLEVKPEDFLKNNNEGSKSD